MSGQQGEYRCPACGHRLVPDGAEGLICGTLVGCGAEWSIEMLKGRDLRQQGEREALAVPAEAVEAAARALWSPDGMDPQGWYVLRHDERDQWRRLASGALTAALPYLSAQLTVRQVRESVPQIICLCGSTRFYDEFQQANFDLTMAGKIVLSVGFYPHAIAKAGHGEGVGHNSVEKVALDELHKRKIDLADRVLVLNVGGYIGSSTRGEIDYALAHGVPVDYLEPVSARIARGEKGGE